MNKNINDMVDSVLNGSKGDFSDAFVSEIRDRINTSVANQNAQISQNLLSDETPIEEAKGNSAVYKFNKPKDAQKFIKSASLAGLSNKNFKTKGNEVTVSNIDSDLDQVLHFLARDMKAKIK
jgi:hypothetical protein